MRRQMYVLAALLTLAIPTAVALAPAAFGLNGAASARYTVTATDFKFRYSSTRIRPGTHSFTVVNRGQATHDFKIGTKKTRLLSPGQRQTIRVTLKAGRYRVICTVPGHVALGMKNTLIVRR